MKKVIYVLALYFFSTVLPAQAGGAGATGGALELTQYLNYGELYNQTNQSMSQLQTQMAQLNNLQQQVSAGGTLDWGQAKNLIASTANTVRQSQSIGYNAQVMAAQWSSLYPDFNKSSGTDYFTQYGNWTKQVNATNQAALQVNGQQVANLQSDAATRAQLERLSNDANGSQSQIAAINATNQVALGTYDELTKLRQLQLAQNAAQQVYLQKQNATEDAKAASDKNLQLDLKANPPCYPNCSVGNLLQGAGN